MAPLPVNADPRLAVAWEARTCDKNRRMPPPRPVRTAARALIIRDEKLLAIKMRDRDGVFFVLPGGGQAHGETLKETLLRECREEIGCEVEVGDIAYVREYIGAHHGFAARHRHFHQLEVVFHCSLPPDGALSLGCNRDNLQVGVCWLALDRLDSLPLFPAVIKPLLGPQGFHGPALYLGDIN